MDCIYVFIEINDWEDAINESKKYPKARVEIFKIDQEVGYTPTYNFYKNGELITRQKV